MGIGRRHTPHAFVQACEKFTFSEVLTSSFIKEPHQTAVKSEITESVTEPSEAAAKPNTAARSGVELNRSVDLNLVQRAFLRAVNEDTGQAYLSTFAEALRKLDSTFDHRNFGFTSFRTFCESLENDYDVVTDDRRSLIIVERKSRTEKTTGTSKTVRISEASCSPEREADGETEREGGREGGKIRSVALSERLDNSVKIWDPASKAIEKAAGDVPASKAIEKAAGDVPASKAIEKAAGDVPASKAIEKAAGDVPVTRAELKKNIRKLRVASSNGKATKVDVSQAVQTLKEFTSKQSAEKAKPHTQTAQINIFSDETLEKAHNVVMGAPGVSASALQADGKGSSHTGPLTFSSQETLPASRSKSFFAAWETYFSPKK
jgi:hypothetical protein